MGNIRTIAAKAAGALLLSLALFGCDSSNPVTAPEILQGDLTVQAEQELGMDLGNFVIPAQTPVDIHAIFSGPPNRDPNQISLDDPSVFVQILDIEQYLPRSASPMDVRIGPSWEDGTPAENFEILDINNDGNRDIQLRFSTQRLIDDGHLTANTTELVVWGRDPNTGVLYRGEAEVEIIGGPPPAGMEDLVVVNDLNVFHNLAIDFVGTDNPQFVRNLVTFTNAGPRSQGTVVWWDRGRNCRCLQLPDFQRSIDVIAAAGFSVEVIQSDVGNRFLDIPMNVRTIWLWTPTIDYTTAEINALKQFITEGGRILFIGENGSFYTAAGLATMNSFLTRMGVSIRTIGGVAGVGYTTTPNIEPHPLMQGVSALRFAGAGILTAGPEADVMFYDHTGANILAATEPIDPTPLTGREIFPLFRDYLPLRGPATATGQ